MATTATPASTAADQLRDARRAAGAWLRGPGLWVIIGAFMTWAVFFERDAFVVGVVAGSIFALGALGLTLIYGVLKFGHFAHGDMMMLSGYLAFFFLFGFVVGERPSDRLEILPVNVNDLPGAADPIWKFSFGYGLWVAMIIAAAAMAVILVGLDRVVYRRLRERKSGIVIFSIAALGIAIAVRAVMLFFWGPSPRLYYPGIRERVDLPFDVSLLADQLFILFTAILATAVVYWLLFYTRLGKAMRAMSDNPDLARVSGINTDRLITQTWIVAGALVAVAGVLLSLQVQLDPDLGFILLLPLFASAILGGLGNPIGALVGGLIVGITQEVAVTFDLPLIGDVSAGYKFSIAFIILILILLVRPNGLFGAKV
jgi:branched-chain amino acid transport system permease protein/neutral amino acid transport system permease protein